MGFPKPVIGSRRRIAIWLGSIAAALIVSLAGTAQAATFTVNSTADPGDGTCSSANCTLHEAIGAANAAAGTDTIGFSVTGQIDLEEALPTIATPMQIVGPGASQLYIHRIGATPFRIFKVDGAAAVSISGLNASNGGVEINFPDLIVLEGGGIYIGSGSSLTLDDVVVTGNTLLANSTGGGLNVGSALGAGIANYGSLTLHASRVSANTATASASGGDSTASYALGAGIYSEGTLTLDHSTVQTNWARAFGTGEKIASGGGIRNEGVASLTGSTVWLNLSGDGDGAPGGSPGGGGGITNVGTLVAVNSTLSGNIADDFGGGIENAGGTQLSSVTIAGNQANVDGSGLGEGGGTWNGAGTTTVKNSLYFDNVVGAGAGSNDQCGGVVSYQSQGYNLRETDDFCDGFNATGDIVNNGFTLGPLAGNGGPTMTHALPIGSAAVNGGNPAVPGSGGPACPATDQRGLYRGGSAGRCDVGAFELGATVSPPSGPITTPPNTPNTSNMVGAAHKKCKKKKHKRAAAAKKKKCKRGKK